MAILVWGVGLFGALFLIHVAVCRGFSRLRRPLVLVVFCAGIPLFALLIGVIGVGAGYNQLAFPASGWDCLYIAFLYFSLCAAYIQTYPGIAADSPTLVIIRMIGRAGKSGLKSEEIFNLASDALLIEPRLADLVSDGLVIREADAYALTSRGARFIRVFIFFRRWMGIERKGG